MADKVVLHYFNGRGKMESIRWLLTVAEVEVGLSKLIHLFTAHKIKIKCHLVC